MAMLMLNMLHAADELTATFNDRVLTIQFECARFNVGSRMLVCCQSLYSIMYYLFSHSINLNVPLFTINLHFTTQHFLSCIEADHAITNVKELPMFFYNL